MKEDWKELALTLARELESCANDLRDCIDDGDRGLNRLAYRDFDGLRPFSDYDYIYNQNDLDSLEIANVFDRTWTRARAKIAEINTEITKIYHELNLIGNIQNNS